MHGIGTVEILSRSDDIQDLALRPVEFNIPCPFLFVKYVRIILRLCSVLFKLSSKSLLYTNVPEIEWGPGTLLMILADQGLLSSFF